MTVLSVIRREAEAIVMRDWRKTDWDSWAKWEGGCHSTGIMVDGMHRLVAMDYKDMDALKAQGEVAVELAFNQLRAAWESDYDPGPVLDGSRRMWGEQWNPGGVR